MPNLNDEQHVRQTLLALREDLQARRQRLAAHGRDGVPADFAEQAVARENDEVVVDLERQVVVGLAEVDAALRRLEQGRYGVCESCGEVIEPRRLDAVPTASRCSSCAD